MKLIYKYVKGGDQEFRTQQKKVMKLVEQRMNALSEKTGLPAYMTMTKGAMRTCIDVYIAETSGMQQREKMRWLSEFIGDDHEAFMKEWKKMMTLSNYRVTNDFEQLKKVA